MELPLIELQELTKKYPQKNGSEILEALKNVSLTVFKGESLGICGESGAGKSSLSRLLLGLETFDSGRMVVDGKDINGRSQRHNLHRFIQIVWQDPRVYLNPYYTVTEQIMEPLNIFFPDEKAFFKEQVEGLLAAVGIPWSLAGRRPHELSGGQCQRVSIARALAVKPQLLICDEALAGLDIPEQVRIIRLLSDLQKARQLTYIVIDHNLNVIHHLCARLAVMKEGKILEIGCIEDILNHPQCSYTQLLVQNFLQLDMAVIASNSHQGSFHISEKSGYQD